MLLIYYFCPTSELVCIVHNLYVSERMLSANSSSETLTLNQSTVALLACKKWGPRRGQRKSGGNTKEVFKERFDCLLP